MTARPTVTGLLLAAGAGRRMGIAKGLLRHDDGTPWVARAAGALADGGCSGVLVVVGAQADAVAALVPEPARVVVAEDWAQGMGASLRTGLAALDEAPPAGAEPVDVVAVLVGLVDTPGVTAQVVGRLVAAASGPAGPAVLARAAFDGVPGHPVLIGRDHWAAVARSATEDVGARDYLRARRQDVVLVECGDIGSGEDLDTPADVAGGGLTLEP